MVVSDCCTIIRQGQATFNARKFLFDCLRFNQIVSKRTVVMSLINKLNLFKYPVEANLIHLYSKCRILTNPIIRNDVNATTKRKVV